MRVADKQIGQSLTQDPGAGQFSLRDPHGVSTTNQGNGPFAKLLPKAPLQRIHLVKKCPGIIPGRVTAGRRGTNSQGRASQQIQPFTGPVGNQTQLVPAKGVRLESFMLSQKALRMLPTGRSKQRTGFACFNPLAQ